MAGRTDRPLIVIGSGPGIGRHVAATFASKRFNKVALVARNPTSLAADQTAVEQALPGKVTVKTYAVDITDSTKFSAVLDTIGLDLGAPECVFFNAAVITPAGPMDVSEETMIYEFKISCTALRTTAQWAVPQLLSIAEADTTSKPSFIVTSSLLPKEPIPQLFSLSLVKSAQRNMVQSLDMLYGSRGIHFGVTVVGGVVDPAAETLNPTNIASRTWDLFEQEKGHQGFQVEIL